MKFASAARWYLAAGLSATLVLIAGWFLLIGPQRSTADELSSSAASKVSENAQAQAHIASLKAQFKDLPALQLKDAEVRSHIPQAPSMPALLRDLSSDAKSAGVTLVGVTPQQPMPLSEPAGGAGGAASLSTPGLVNQIPMTIQISGTFAHMQTFLSNIEGMQRAMLITGIDISRDGTGEGPGGTVLLKAALDARVFMANAGQLPSQVTTTTPSTADAAS